MKNQQNVPHGFDMLNDDKSFEKRELETLSPLLSSADRWFDEDEEKAARSESSSGGSSPSDLKKRLQHLPSPHEATRLTNHGVAVTRRVSRKREFCVRTAANRIEENVEKEEKEERESLFCKKSFGNIKAKDARARRRAKIRLESARNRSTTAPRTTEQFIVNSNDEENSDKDQSIENKLTTILEQSLERLSSTEMLNNVHRVPRQQCISLSARLPSTHSPYRNQQDETKSDSSRSQKSTPFLRLYSSISCDNSPKDKVDPQPLSSVSLNTTRPIKFGGYRPQAGLILQNLSSSSEAESSHDVLSGRIDPDQSIQRSTPIMCSNIYSSNSDSRAENLNDSLPSVSNTPRKSCNRIVNSSRKDVLEQILASTVSNANVDENFHSVEPFTSKKVSLEDCVYRPIASTSRSDCSKSVNNTIGDKVAEPMFYSAREETQSFRNNSLETSKLSLDGSTCSDASPNVKISTSLHENVSDFERDISNLSTRRNSEKYLEENKKETDTNLCHSSPSLESNMSQNFTPSSTSIRSSENVFKNFGIESPSNEKFELPRSSIGDTMSLKQTISRCILSYDNNNDIKSPSSQDDRYSPQFKSCKSATSTSAKLFVSDFGKLLEDHPMPLNSAKIDEQLNNSEPDKTVNDKEFTNVPNLPLASQEVSHTTSPACKTFTETHLDPDSLIMALSNATLKQEFVRDASENDRDDSLNDSKTVSEPGSSGNVLLLSKRSETKSIENLSMQTTTRTSCRSSLGMRSRIPVKIPSNRSRLSVGSKYGESVDQLTDQTTSPVESKGQFLRGKSSSPDETSQLAFARVDQTPKTHGSSSSAKNCENLLDDIEIIAESLINKKSREASRYSSSRCSKDNLENLETINDSTNDVSSNASIPLQTRRSNYSQTENRATDLNLHSEDSSEGSSRAESPINYPRTGETYRSSKFVEAWKEPEKIEENDGSDDNSFLEDDTDSVSSQPYEIIESVEELMEEETVTPRIQSIETEFGDYPNKRFRNTYEGEVCDKIVEQRKSNIVENRIGDGRYQQIEMADTSGQAFGDSSPDDEDYIRGKMFAENHEKLRYSLEKLAVDQFRRSIGTDKTKPIQSDTAAYFTDRFYETPQFPLACSSSTSKLCHDKSRDSPKFKKKSQDRFPFTISEKTSVASTKLKGPSRLGNLDEDEEDRGYRLDTHPSITRLAGSGFEDSPADIISYVIRNEKNDRQSRPFGIKGMVKKFSARWKKSRRPSGEDNADTKEADIIYKNRDYREEYDSSVQTCSESSESSDYKIYQEESEKTSHQNGDDSMGKKSPTTFDERSIYKKKSKSDIMNTANPCRRYDRDDLWVQALKDIDSSREERKEELDRSNKMEESPSNRDPYSVFFVKSAQETPEASTRTIVAEDKEDKQQNISTEKKKNRVKFRGSSMIITQKLSDRIFPEKVKKMENLERRRRNRRGRTGCLCLRFYRMIIPVSFRSMSKYRSRINDKSSSIKKRSRLSLPKKKG